MYSITRKFILSCRIPLEYASIRNWGAKPKIGQIIDPEVLKEREERKRKKLIREIEFLLKNEKKFRPIDELQLSSNHLQTLNKRNRPPVKVLAQDEVERRRASRAYQRSRNLLLKKDNKFIKQAIKEQDRALKVLKNLSPKLYEETVQVEPSFEFSFIGPSITPPIKEYEAPNGDYIDMTTKYEPEKQIDDLKLLGILRTADQIMDRYKESLKRKEEQKKAYEETRKKSRSYT